MGTQDRKESEEGDWGQPLGVQGLADSISNIGDFDVLTAFIVAA